MINLVINMERKNTIEILKQGNMRFKTNESQIKHYSQEERKIMSEDQEPIVVVVTCSDSRVTPEEIFDLNLGEAFVIRNAGNIAEIETLSSVAYAVSILKVDTIVVLGHSNCGAISGAMTHNSFKEPLNRVIHTIRGRIDGETDPYKATLKNIEVTKDSIKSFVELNHAQTEVVGAYYDVATGMVDFLNFS